MTVQERFAEKYGMPLNLVRRLVRLSEYAVRANEHSCNGDKHSLSIDPTDKNANKLLWDKDVDVLTEKIHLLATGFGFTTVVYTGLGPTLKRGDEFVEIPY